MKSINFNSGIREYAINGDENNVIRINVTDLNLLKRIEDVTPRIDELKERFGDKKNPAAQEFFEMDKEIRSIFNDTFGFDICSKVFGNTNCCSLVGSGELLFMAFFNAFIPLLKEDISAALPDQKAEIRPEVQNYLNDNAMPAESIHQSRSGIDVGALGKDEKMQLIAQLLS